MDKIFKNIVLDVNANKFSLLFALLTTVCVVVILFIQNYRLEKKIKIKNIELTDMSANIKKSDDKIKNLLINLHVGVAVFSPKGERLLSNRKFFELSTSKKLKDKGEFFAKKSIAEKSFIENLPPISIEEIIENYINEDGQKLTKEEFPLLRVLSTGAPQLKAITGIRDPDTGNVRWTMGDHEPEFDKSGKLSKVIVTLVDITDRKNSEAKVYNMSIHDVLTSLYNRNYFELELDKYNNKDITGVGIVICDIDGLKLINDTLGHAVGDDYITIVADLLCKCFNPDVVVARIGGDEFAVIIENTTTYELSTIELKTNKLLNIINCEQRIIPISMSLGYAVGNDKQKDLRELLKIADNQMYRQKHNHRLGRRE